MFNLTYRGYFFYVTLQTWEYKSLSLHDAQMLITTFTVLHQSALPEAPGAPFPLRDVTERRCSF